MPLGLNEASYSEQTLPNQEGSMRLGRREFVERALVATGGYFSVSRSFAAGKQRVRWAPYQCLDLEPNEMSSDEDIARIVRFAKEFIPQSNTGKRAYDPKNPDDRRNERAIEGHGKRIHASEMSISVPNTYSKAAQIKKGIARVLEADTDHAVRDMMTVGLQFHTTSFDVPNDGVEVPPGFDWNWVMTVPHKVADEHRRAWTDAGFKFSPTPSVELAIEKVKSRGWPTGWLRANATTKTASQYTIMPDLRIAACRKYFLDRYASINKELGLINVGLGGKSAWLHGNALPRNRPGSSGGADPWLPSPYPGDSYRDANVALVKEAVARFGAEHVTWTNTSSWSPEERRAQNLPDYVSLRDGGIREIYDEWFGSWSTNWTLKLLVSKGAL